MFPHSLFVVADGLVWFLVGRGFCLFCFFFLFHAQIADMHTTKGLHGYSAVSVGCSGVDWSVQWIALQSQRIAMVFSR